MAKAKTAKAKTTKAAIPPADGPSLEAPRGKVCPECGGREAICGNDKCPDIWSGPLGDRATCPSCKKMDILCSTCGHQTAGDLMGIMGFGDDDEPRIIPWKE